ncbi:hypothetical protein M8Q41_24975, partial [Enterobacter cloacae]|nr:hypothetical protein [Enterobacter cloacae]
GMVCVVGRMRDLILQLSKSSIYSTKPLRTYTKRIINQIDYFNKNNRMRFLIKNKLNRNSAVHRVTTATGRVDERNSGLRKRRNEKGPRYK